MNVQPVIPFGLSDDWNLISRTIVPVVYQDGVLPGDGIDVRADREADGRMPVIDRLLAAAAPTGAKPVAAPANAPLTIDLTSPAEVDGFRLQHVRLHVRDKRVSPPLDAMVQLDVRADDIGAGGRPARFYVNVSSDPVLDGLTIEGTARSAGAAIDTDVTVTLRGLHLRPLAAYLAPLGVRPVAYDLSAKASGTLRASPAAMAAADEQADSRIYGGIHFRFDSAAGQRIGRDMGGYVLGHVLTPRDNPGRGGPGRGPAAPAQAATGTRSMFSDRPVADDDDGDDEDAVLAGRAAVV